MKLPSNKISTKVKASALASIAAPLTIVIVGLATSTSLKETEVGRFLKNPDNVSASISLMGVLLSIATGGATFASGYYTEEKAFNNESGKGEGEE